MADSRIDELRKRLEKEPGSRLFAQLAEELRKGGELAEAVRVCRDGLQKQPTYHSARMTLARALLDSGDRAAARPEFEAVLKAAPDNILASRLLAECLEGLGDLQAARARYRTTLALAPSDRQVQSRLEAVEARLAAPRPAPPSQAPASPPPAEPEPVAAAPVAEPIPVVEAEPRPIPLVAAEESFELEAAYEAPTTRIGIEQPAVESSPAPSVAAPQPEPEAAPAAVDEAEQEFVDFEAEAREQPAPIEVVSRVPLAPEPAAPAPPAPAAAAPPAAAPAAAPVELASPTLGELYFSQGHAGKAIEVYRQVVEREPANERARARLTELEAIERHLAGAASVPPGQGRREALRRTIKQLEGMMAAAKRGVSG
ncbi:MAG TPA: tetratricopeptide repeat protein [Vicinamibacteria bacterium]|nr:tetratricopeptide repeat protein [Vicinamibacteria bacterium]